MRQEPDNKLYEHEEKPASNGEWLMKTLKPLGAAIVLVCMVLMIISCFVVRFDPIKGYEPLNTTEFYSENLEELQSELEENVFPNFEGIRSSDVNGDRLDVLVSSGEIKNVKQSILKHFDSSLFNFVSVE